MQDSERVTARLLKRYGAAVDGRRWDAFDGIFDPTVHADYGGPEVFSGLAAFKEGAKRAWGSFDLSQHLLSPAIWEEREACGRSLAYGDWLIVRRDAVGGDTWRGKGWYYDEWRNGEDGWRIVRRICRPMWWTGNPLVPDATFDPDQFDASVEIKTYSLWEAIAEGLFTFEDF